MGNDAGCGKFLTICADDFGMNPAIDEAILRLAELGRLSAASCMPYGPSFRSHADALSTSGLQLGLHLNFTEALNGEGLYRPLPWLIAAAYGRRLDAAAVERQIVHQLDAFEEVLRRGPDFIDGHQHVHQLPIIRDCLLRELVRRYAVADRPWLRSTIAAAQPGVPWPLRGKALVIQMLGARRFARQAGARGFTLNKGFLGVYGFSGGEAAYRRLLACWLRAAGDGALLMCHPATAAADDDVLGAQRVAEFRVLAGDGMAQLLRDTGFSLARPDGFRFP